jgi:predicted dehydrogenase
MGHVRMLAQRNDAEITVVCDADKNRAEEAARTLESAGKRRPKQVQDLRRVLDDNQVNAVLIATPDHWHAPAAILACKAGKHVYVEKPCSHNIREGRLLAEAAGRYKRVVQTGTQSRSAKHVQEAMQALKEGIIGEVLVAKAWNSQLRANIGRANPSKPPDSLDYDLWVGPAPMVPHQANRLHYTWHWWHDFGTGDMGNDGVHDLDIARWGLGVDTHPSRVTAVGAKLFFDDDQQFPDTQYAVFDYPGVNGRRKQLIYEHRIWSPYVQEGHENGNAFYGTEGVMILGKKSGWQVLGPGNKPIKSGAGGLVHPDHHTDFFQCIRNNNKPTADVTTGHLSATLCHLGNIAARTGRILQFDPAKERIAGDDRTDKLLGRAYRQGHWAIPQDK